MAAKKSTAKNTKSEESKEGEFTTFRATRETRTSLLDRKFIEDKEFSQEVDAKRENKHLLPITILVTALITSLLTLGLTQQISPTLSDRTTLAAQTSGGVCLTESELKSLLRENDIQAYWTGPLEDATYTLNASTTGQVFIRYVPSGEQCDDVRPNYRVIATYAETNAFATTEAAGGTADGVSLLNADGSIVYFNKNVPTNIYVAFPGIDYQIEIYDPDPKEAVTLATTQGSIQMIKG